MSLRRFPLAVVAVAWFGLWGLLVGATCPPPPNDPSAYGVNGTKRGLTDAYTLAHDAGFRWIRVTVGWNKIEPNRPVNGVHDYRWQDAVLGPDEFPKESFDTTVIDPVSAGFSLLVNVVGAPSWATGTDDPMDPPVLAPDGYAQFLAAAVDRYGALVNTWELWAEPNFNANFHGTKAQYRDLIFTRGFDAIKSTFDGARVAAPGIYRGVLSPEKGTAFQDWIVDPTDPATLRLLRPLDVLTVHLYDSIPNITSHLNQANTFATNRGIPEVWVSEFGWTDPGTSCSQNIPSANAGARIIDVFNLLHGHTIARFKRAFDYHLHDRTGPAVDGCLFGLLTQNGTPKTRYNDVKTWLLANPDPPPAP
jgi:hypothetical protein